MFSNYIRKNKLLFILSIVIAMETLLGFSMAILEGESNKYFSLIKDDSSISGSMTSAKWDLLDYVWRSGEVMSTYGNISRLKGYQDTTFPNLIVSLFTGSKTTSNANTSTTLIHNFQILNLIVQLSTVVICLVGILIVVKIYLLGVIVRNYLITAESWNFKKLTFVFFLHLLGFYISYKWSETLSKQEREDKWWWLYNSKFVTRNRNLRNAKGSFSILNNSNDVILETKNLCFSVNKNKNYILKNIDLQIKKGSFNVIIGPNGSGKTTLIKSLINLNEGCKGEILWNGKEVSSINRTEFARQVSYIPQFLNLQNSISILDFLEFSRYPYKQLITNSPEIDQELVIQAIKKNGCEKLKDKMVDELSGGQKQKIMLTSVLVQESEVIILDEPTSFLDIKNQHQFLETLKDFQRKGKTIIMILHDLRQSISCADNLIVLKDGSIHASGHPRDVITKDLLKNIFRIDCDVNKTLHGIQISNIHAL